MSCRKTFKTYSQNGLPSHESSVQHCARICVVKFAVNTRKAWECRSYVIFHGAICMTMSLSSLSLCQGHFLGKLPKICSICSVHLYKNRIYYSIRENDIFIQKLRQTCQHHKTRIRAHCVVVITYTIQMDGNVQMTQMKNTEAKQLSPKYWILATEDNKSGLNVSLGNVLTSH